MADLGQVYPSRGAVQETYTEGVLQRLDLVADRLCRDVEAARSGGEAAFLGDRCRAQARPGNGGGCEPHDRIKELRPEDGIERSRR